MDFTGRSSLRFALRAVQRKSETAVRLTPGENDMARTPSNMLPLGTVAPSFSLYDTVSGQTRTLHDLKSTVGTVVMFICNHCPFVKHVAEELSALGREYLSKRVSFIAISSNDISKYPDDAPEKMTLFAKEYGFVFPYLFDETQSVARAYDAACTPDFYLFDREMKLVYRGQLDDSRPDNGVPVTGRDLRRAIDQLIAGEPIDSNQTPSLGCNIKWRERA